MNSCECGKPVLIKSTGECSACYTRRIRARNIPRYYPGGPVIRECTYIAAHHRVRYYRGSAKQYLCAICGQVAAQEWSYRGGSEYEQSVTQMDTRRGHVRDMPYSGNPQDYDPVCIPDHIKRDMKRSNDA